MRRRTIHANLIMPKSSVIKRMNFNDNFSTLRVVFKSGNEYIYTPVSQEFYKKLEDSESKGKFFNKHIKNNEALTCFKFIK